jgi:hypothetical protein
MYSEDFSRDDNAAEVNIQTLKKLTRYWKIYFPELTDECWKSGIESFRKRVMAHIASGKNISFGLAAAAQKFEPVEVRELCGKHRLYRYAYKNTGDVALEWLIIENKGDRFLEVRLYSAPYNDIDSLPLHERHELFSGRLYHLGQAYLALISHAGARDTRARTLILAAKPSRGRAERYGLLTGLGANTELPSCARFVVVKESKPVGADDHWERTISEKELDWVGFAPPGTLPDEYLLSIDNNIKVAPVDRSGGDYVLIAGRVNATASG